MSAFDYIDRIFLNDGDPESNDSYDIEWGTGKGEGDVGCPEGTKSKEFVSIEFVEKLWVQHGGRSEFIGKLRGEK